MKNLIIINGTMGVGKTATCRELQKLLPHNVFLDGDWCWDMKPFVVNDETRTMVMNNICYLLNQFLHCSQYENILFCWVMHKQSIVDDVLSRLDTTNCQVRLFSLVANREALEQRLRRDVEAGLRTDDIIERSVSRIGCYPSLTTEKIDTSYLTQKQAAEMIYKKLELI
jgi:hypothetical protein